MKRLLFLVIALLVNTIAAHAQAVNFKLIYNGTLARYEVYMNSATAYSGPQARISSGYVRDECPC